MLTQFPNIKLSRKALIIWGFVATIFLLLLALIKINLTDIVGANKETALAAQYRENQNYLSAFKAGFYEQFAVAQKNADELGSVLEGAVKGRYDTGSSQTALPNEKALFSAMVEVYPDLIQIDVSHQRIIDYVQAQRTGYQNMQIELLDMLRSYDSWLNQGVIHPIWVSLAGFPSSDTLKVTIGNRVVTGQAALGKMHDIVLTEQAQEIYETGTDEWLIVSGNTYLADPSKSDADVSIEYSL